MQNFSDGAELENFCLLQIEMGHNQFHFMHFFRNHLDIQNYEWNSLSTLLLKHST